MAERLRQLAGGLSIVLSFFLSTALASGTTASQCDGHDVTISGTADDDTIDGTEKLDVIWGGPGNDVINGQGGNDRICGGPGNDRLAGGGTSLSDPHDRLLGGKGIDTAFFPGAQGGTNAYVERRGFGGGGVAKTPGLGMNRLFGIENLRGTNAYGDSLHGDSATNKLSGRGGGDDLQGRGGDDRLVGGTGKDTANGGRGNDECLNVETSSKCE